MQFPAIAVVLMQQVYLKFPDLPHGDDNARRLLIRRCGEQLVYVLGPRWGNKKRAGVGDEFRSKDAIAYLEDDGTCSIWDTQNGATRQLSVRAGSEPHFPHVPISEATFMALSPVDHLGTASPVEPPVPPVDTLAERVKTLEQSHAELHAKVDILKASAVHKPLKDQLPRYVAKVRIFGYTITVVSMPE